MTIGEKIKASRESAGLTQEELASMCGTTKQTIYKYEIGKVVNIPLDRLEKIANAVSVSPAYLTGWETDKKAPPCTDKRIDSSEFDSRSNETVTDICQKLRRLRAESGLTQEQFGKIAGVSGKAVSTWESGSKTPRFRSIQLLCSHFGIDLNDFANSNISHRETGAGSSAAAHGNGIGDRIRSCRLQLRLTQTQLGSLLGVKKNAVSKWECGRVSDIPLSKIRAMADLFHVPVSYLADDSMSDPTTLKPANTSPNLIRLTYGGATTEKALSSEQALALKMIIDQLPEADDL